MRRLLLACLAGFAVPLASAAPEKWAADIDKLTATDATNPPPRDGVVFVGSSSIVGWTTLARDFPGEKVIRRGFGGSELADSVFYADRIVTPYRPRAVVLYAGDNDLHAGKSPAQVLSDFEAFVAKVHSALPQTRIIFIAMKPSPARWQLRENYERANGLIAATCAKDPARLRFVDIWHPMLDGHGQPRAELFVEDKLHLNATGYAVWTPLVAEALIP